MLARLVQRWSLVEGGSLPGSMKAPITPPSNRMVNPGQRSRCARVAASSGMPTPATTTCPSVSWRGLRVGGSAGAVYLGFLSIVDALPGARRLEQFLDSDQGEKFAPRFRSVDVAFHVLLHPFDGMVVHKRPVILNVTKHRLDHR